MENPVSYFKQLPAPRIDRCKEHLLEDIIFIKYLPILLQQPDTTTAKGRRDIALLSLMYDTGARVQEIIDLNPAMLQLTRPAIIKIKGKKVRLVPMLDSQVSHLKNYIKESGLDKPHTNMYPLFSNARKEKLTRAGISHIVRKYANIARGKNDLLIPDRISCHSLRHSKAMHLLQAGKKERL